MSFKIKRRQEMDADKLHIQLFLSQSLELEPVEHKVARMSGIWCWCHDLKIVHKRDTVSSE